MKTKWIMIPVLALAWGCGREIENSVSYIDGEITLYATSGEGKTRTVLQQDGSVYWNPEDCINVFYGSLSGKFTSSNTAPADYAEFTGLLGSFVLDGETEFVAVYPYDEGTTLSGQTLNIRLPAEQTAVEGTFADDLFICAAKSKDYNLFFYNVCGGVKFSLAREDIRKVVFRGNGGEPLAGRLSVGFDSEGLPQVDGIIDGNDSVTLVAPDGGTFKAGAFYYLVLAPQMLEHGYTMEMYAGGLVGTVSSDSSVSVRRSAWGVLKELSPVVSVAVPDMVDLGLPSGLKWASFNLGATRPEEYGDYYAWGETEPYYTSQDPLTWKEGKEAGYYWTSYMWCMGSNTNMTKYCTDSSYGYNGFTDGKIILDPEDDAAQVNLGGNWRMPIVAEQDELREECSWEWTQVNGINGCKVTGPNGNSIFLPAAGIWLNADLYYAGSEGFYCSSSLDTDDQRHAYNLVFYSDYEFRNRSGRSFGFSVRPVYGDSSIIPVESITLDNSELDLAVGGEATLNATVLPENATNKAVSWSSSNESVATVSSSGVVTGVALGSAIITVTTVDGGKTATCSVTVKDSSPYTVATPEVIDLGLPSGLKWASFNLGASKPEEYGDYYAWGETEPKYSSLDPLVWKPGKEEGYWWPTHKWCMGDETTLTKYCNDSSCGYNGYTDGKTVLDPEDDAAHVNLGGKWRMPTDNEMTELRDNCSWEWTSMNGINGYKVSGPNGNSIFLPAAGYWYFSSSYNLGSLGLYWSSTLDIDAPYYAWYMYFSSGNHDVSCDDRSPGASIRPVYGDTNTFPVESVTLDKSELELTVRGEATLNATVLPENATNKAVTWSSSNFSVATVSSSGVVTGVAPGTAIITVTTVDGGKTATCSVTVKDSSPYTVATPEAIDLGLPSGLKWASFNLGATKPEELGDYFSWGETEPYYSSQDPLTWKKGNEGGYDWTTYKWCMGSDHTQTKYCTDSSYGYNGFTDGKTLLDPEDDAANVNLGSNWRMPKKEEQDELLNQCSWEWTQVNGINGHKVTGPNGNSIFLPAAGVRVGTNLLNAGSTCHYWSSSLNAGSPNGAMYVRFDSGDVLGSSTRCRGFSVRPVFTE